jgi:hypothetical protein
VIAEEDKKTVICKERLKKYTVNLGCPSSLAETQNRAFSVIASAVPLSYPAP